ncbi:MAG: hypothetical protein SH859_10075 [Hyphomicrobium aestuarii]|nr:hypothetical protein [Hyphomicrobium aestuarii]
MTYLRPLVATLIMTSAAFAAAPASADVTDSRQARQSYRIEQGIRSGTLTRGEAYRLEAEQDRIRAIERNAKRDGYLDPHERRRLLAEQDRASRNIRAEKHDHQDRRFHYRSHDHDRSYGRRWNGHRWVFGWGPRFYY